MRSCTKYFSIGSNNDYANIRVATSNIMEANFNTELCRKYVGNTGNSGAWRQ